jgi:hypothetical protein
MPVAPDHKMVNALDVHEFSCLSYGTSDCHIIWAWGGVRGWVVMHNRYCCGIAPDGSFEYLPHPNLR